MYVKKSFPKAKYQIMCQLTYIWGIKSPFCLNSYVVESSQYNASKEKIYLFVFVFFKISVKYTCHYLPRFVYNLSVL